MTSGVEEFIHGVSKNPIIKGVAQLAWLSVDTLKTCSEQVL